MFSLVGCWRAMPACMCLLLVLRLFPPSAYHVRRYERCARCLLSGNLFSCITHFKYIGKTCEVPGFLVSVAWQVHGSKENLGNQSSSLCHASSTKSVLIRKWVLQGAEDSPTLVRHQFTYFTTSSCSLESLTLALSAGCLSQRIYIVSSFDSPAMMRLIRYQPVRVLGQSFLTGRVSRSCDL